MRRKGSVCSSEPFGTLRVNDGSESILSIECGVASRPPSNAGSLDRVIFVIFVSGEASLERRADVAERFIERADIHPRFRQRVAKAFFGLLCREGPREAA